MEPTELQGSGSNGPLLWGMDTYIVTQSTDTANFIFAIKQGDLGQDLKIYHYLIAQLA